MESAQPPLEDRVTEAWRVAFDLPNVSPESDFFELGGTSVLALTLAWELTEQLGFSEEAEAELIMAVFDHPTPQALTSYLERELLPSR
jgi:acyl carrier protein